MAQFGDPRVPLGGEGHALCNWPGASEAAGLRTRVHCARACGGTQHVLPDDGLWTRPRGDMPDTSWDCWWMELLPRKACSQTDNTVPLKSELMAAQPCHPEQCQGVHS